MHETVVRIAHKAARTRLAHALRRMKKPFNIVPLIARSARRFQKLRTRPKVGIHVSDRMKRPLPAWTILAVLLMGAGLGYFAPVAVNMLTGAAQSSTPDFTIGLSPATITIAQGGLATLTVSMNSINGFAGSVNLNATVSPVIMGATFGLNPSSSSLFTGTASATLTVTVPGNTPVGAFSLKVTGASGKIVHSVTTGLQVTVPAPPDFQLTANPASINITRGSADSSTIILTSLGGFSGIVNMTASISPSNGASPTLSLNPLRVTLLSDSTSSVLLTISTTGTTIRGIYSVVVQGQSGTLSNTVTVSIVVQ